ncbi:MAG: glycosyltransferase family 2 protein [Bacteroidota bacterium]
MKRINCFVPFQAAGVWDETLEELTANELVNQIYLMGPEAPGKMAEGCAWLKTDGRFSTDTIKKIAERSTDVSHTMLITGETMISFGMLALERFVQVAEDTGAGMVYADHYDLKEEKNVPHPVIDYQAGSLRDDFEFGPVVVLDSERLNAACKGMGEAYDFAGLYQLRLKLSQDALPVHIQEYLYTVHPIDIRTSGEQQFDYVDPRNREVQVEMERVVTTHLKETGAFLKPEFEPIAFDQAHFKMEASVIMPLLNRARTIADAVESVMTQKTDFDFNMIVVDNRSTDGSTEILQELSEKYPNLLHVIPERRDLGIGGCWNLGIHHPECGKFAVQLDSDDLYSDEDTLQKMVRAFYDQQCAMVIGAYRMTDFDLEEIPPGIIDHKEWTPENGRNNALRINGLGAPRAFYTPVLREINVPNVSYGEDYGLGLVISRNYQIGRIYIPLYLCRRWEDNSDASLSIEAMNKHNHYKDKLRTYEVMARLKMNLEK